MESKWITHTADDEKPDCQKCDHITDDFDCSRKCGPKRGWKGYSREEKVEDDGDYIGYLECFVDWCRRLRKEASDAR